MDKSGGKAVKRSSVLTEKKLIYDKFPIGYDSGRLSYDC